MAEVIGMVLALCPKCRFPLVLCLNCLGHLTCIKCEPEDD